MKILLAIYRFFLVLRYKVELKGVNVLQTPRAKFILPNHQALVDPQLLVTHLAKYIKVVPVVTESFYKIPVLNSFLKKMGAVPVSDLSAGSRDVKVLNTISENVYKAFTEKRNVLLYPSGQIAGQGYEKIFNKKSAFLVCRDLPTDVQVIAVRISGLWGSMWSRAWVGDSPPFFPTFLRAIFMVFANLLFFLPRRKVTIEFIDISKEARKQAIASIKDFNSYLESIYNEKGEEPVLFLKHYFFAPKLKRNLPPNIKGSVADLLNANEQTYNEIPSEVLQKVTEIVKNKAGIGNKEIGANSNLNFDCSVDSLMLVDIIEDIEKQFTIKADISENNIKTVGDLCFVAMNKKVEHEVLKAATISTCEAPVKRIFIPAEGTIAEILVKTFSEHPNETFSYDKMIGTTTRKQFLLKAMVVSKIIKQEVQEEYVGIMLPALQSTTLLVAATYLAGKIPVMLNWTVGPKLIEHCVETVGVKKILTAKSFADKVSDQLPQSVKQKCVFFEDKVKALSTATKLKGLFAYFTKSVPKIKATDVAVVLFTSGSESLPKAVKLTHKNVLTNLHGAFSHISLNTDLVLLSFLPPFHSFGFTVCTILPLTTAVKTAYTPDPTNGREVLKILNHTNANTLLGTPTFLKLLLAVAQNNELKNVRLVISGAESLQQVIAEQFKLKASPELKMLEGYGITECSPVLTLNPLEKQKVGSVGTFIKGVDFLITTIDTYTPVAVGSEGMILVRGGNIFSGYEDKNIASPFVTVNGIEYYKTGDLGYVDSEGYLFITGRLKRFIKIAGEMISLPAIEIALLNKYGKSDSLVLAVEGKDTIEVPQIVLFSVTQIEVNEANETLKQAGFSSLVKIHKNIVVPEIPLLGTGKTDYKVLKAMI